MTSIDWLLLAGWGALCNVWGVLMMMQRRARRDGTMLAPLSERPSDDQAPTEPLCVVIPVRNEAANVVDCVRSVLAQDLPGLSVHVVDDRSDDGTAKLVAEAFADEPRVSCQRVDDLPDGWLGKSHALHAATRELAQPWLVFLDADCRLTAPSALRTATQAARQRGTDLLSLWPALRCGTFWEAMLIPLCSAVMALWYGSSNHPRARGFANGQFLLVRRDAYQAVGGHASVKTAIIEDVPLAQRMRDAGRNTWTGGGAALLSVRMYESLPGVFFGWSRIFVGALRSRAKLVLSVAWLLVGSLLPFVALPFLLCAWLAAGTPVAGVLPAQLLLCITHMVLLVLVSYGFWGLGRCDRRHLWLYPLSVVVALAILGHALWTLGVSRRVGWRSTGYHIDPRARIVPVPRPAGWVTR